MQTVVWMVLLSQEFSSNQNSWGQILDFVNTCHSDSTMHYTQDGTTIRGAMLPMPSWYGSRLGQVEPSSNSKYYGMFWDASEKVMRTASTDSDSGTLLAIDATRTMAMCLKEWGSGEAHCPPGKYFVQSPGWYFDNSVDTIPDGFCNNRCELCPAGKYKPTFGTGVFWGYNAPSYYQKQFESKLGYELTVPIEAVRNSMAFGNSASMCQLCPVGKYSNTLASTACKECLAGQYQYTTAPQSVLIAKWDFRQLMVKHMHLPRWTMWGLFKSRKDRGSLTDVQRDSTANK